MTTPQDCTCPYGERPLGRLYGVSMGRGLVRLSTDPSCHIHHEHTYLGDPPEPCRYCGAPRKAWIHPETRRGRQS